MGQIKIKKITSHPASGVKVKQEIDVIDGEELDTKIEIEASFSVCGASREEFLKKLGCLVDEYSI